ncbi:MAG: carbon storage regulator [Chloroflexi bacterium]|nr:carbon storage regulator [Chloroflexota bacterium]
MLTRKIDQGIVIAGNIYIRVLGVERDRVKIGIDAPREIPVLREELLERDKAKAGTNSTGQEPSDSQHAAAVIDTTTES